MISMPGNLPDALLVERFDIRQDRNDSRRIAVEDMASVRGVAPSEKYEGSIEQAARALRSVSSDAEADVATLFGRAVFAWLIGDGDCHMKNLAVLQIVADGAENFTSVRLAPVYDAVTTKVFPGFKNDHLALSLAGKRHRLSSRDLVRAGVTMGMQVKAARAVIASACDRLHAHLEGLGPAAERIDRAVTIWRARIEATAT